MSFELIDDRIAVRETKSFKTKGGVILPDNSSMISHIGVIITCGPGARSNVTDKRIPLSVNVGDVITFGERSGVQIEIEGEKIRIIRELEILAVLSKEKEPK